MGVPSMSNGDVEKKTEEHIAGIHTEIPVSDKCILAQPSSFSEKWMLSEIFSFVASISIVRGS